jgi:hypothetical protein
MDPSEIIDGVYVAGECTNEHIIKFGEFLKLKYHGLEWTQYNTCNLKDKNGHDYLYTSPRGIYYNDVAEVFNNKSININIFDMYYNDDSIVIMCDLFIEKINDDVTSRIWRSFDCEYDKDNYNKKINDLIDKENNKFYNYLETVDTTVL